MNNLLLSSSLLLAIAITSTIALPIDNIINNNSNLKALEFGENEITIETPDGRDRVFIVYRPTTHNISIPTPLFFVFHGLGNNPQEIIRNMGLQQLANDQNILTIAPEGWEESWNGGGCCGTAARLDIDDVTFFRLMVNTISSLAAVNLGAIYSTGYSNGGYMSYRIACEASDLVTAIGNVAGALSDEDEFRCDQQVKPIPVVHHHGTSDTTIPYRLGENSVAEYIDIQDCDIIPVITFQNRSVTCETFRNCRGGIEVTFCTAEDYGHQWPGCSHYGNGIPGTGGGCSGPCPDVYATPQMYQVLSQYATSLEDETN